MAIVGDRPSRGVRVRLLLKAGHYEGAAMTPAHRWEMRAEVDDEANVMMTTDAPSEVAEYARRVIRIAVKEARKDGRALPRVLQRWRDRE
jgi:hypothetical protein